MPGPARAGALLYASAPERLAGFYEQVLSMNRVHVSGELVVLESPDFQLVVHAIPRKLAAPASPRAPREQTAVRLFLGNPFQVREAFP